MAGATRTWVSGVGDDANPCSRTAPCKTFAGAISKTAAGGEIDAIDPGGFGALTITHAITIDGNGTFASILASGTTGIVVNAGPTDVVTIRNLSIDGGGTGLDGIRFTAGGALHIENCVIFNFARKGVAFQPGAASRLFIKDTIIRNNNDSTQGGAVLIQPGAAGSAQATLDGVRMEGNLFAVLAGDRSAVAVRNSVAAGNRNGGFEAAGNAGNVEINLESCLVAENNAVGATTGIFSTGNLATIRLSNVMVVNNGTGLAAVAGGKIISFGNNRIEGNGTDGAPTATVGQKCAWSVRAGSVSDGGSTVAHASGSDSIPHQCGATTRPGYGAGGSFNPLPGFTTPPRPIASGWRASLSANVSKSFRMRSSRGIVLAIVQAA